MHQIRFNDTNYFNISQCKFKMKYCNVLVFFLVCVGLSIAAARESSIISVVQSNIEWNPVSKKN